MGDGIGDEHDLLADQIRYYEDRADIYEKLYERRDEYDLGSQGNARWFAETSILESSIKSLMANGSVLEIACGTGLWTRWLAPRASRLVCVDTSPRMLHRNRELVGDPRVEYVLADVFEWDPEESFDLIVMGFFLSHIPPGRFAGFWDRVRRWLVREGVVWFCDDSAGPDRPPYRGPRAGRSSRTRAAARRPRVHHRQGLLRARRAGGEARRPWLGGRCALRGGRPALRDREGPNGVVPRGSSLA